MTSPILRAQLENDDSYDDPSEDALFEILADIDAGEAPWVIVERLDDPNRRPTFRPFGKRTVRTSSSAGSGPRRRTSPPEFQT